MKSNRGLACLTMVLGVAFVACLFVLVRSSAHDAYPLLSKRVFVEQPNDTIINFTDLRNELRTLGTTQKNIRIGVYFHYLPSGVSVSVNSGDEFISASLIKVPLVMGIYKMIEKGLLHPDTVLTLTQQDLDPSFGTLWKRGAGAKLTVQEAIRLSLTESDNTAAIALDDASPDDLIREVYNALDIPVNWSGNEPTVSAKNYASVFQCLYLSCYLNYSESEEVLSLLSQTIFHEGISEGFPADIPFAHKIGVYDSPDTSKRVRLDCGIVYVPKRPYILCVLGETKKGDEHLVTDFAKQVSQAVYRFIINPTTPKP